MPELQKKFEYLLKTVKQYQPKADLGLIELAFEFAKEAHKGQKRMTGEEYICHPLATAQTLAEMKLSPPIIIAGLLHDVGKSGWYLLINAPGLRMARLESPCT